LADRPLLDVPNLVHKHGGEVVFNRLEAPVPLGDLPTPDFRGLLLERYPVQMLPVQTNRDATGGNAFSATTILHLTVPASVRPYRRPMTSTSWGARPA